MALVNDYTIVRGFFMHDQSPLAPVPEPHNPLPPAFGLLDDREDRWAAFKTKFDDLVELKKDGEQYKLIVIGRHGQGIHNVADTKWGKEWEEKWAMEYGDGNLVWGPDAELTEVGVGQAQQVNELWKQEIDAGMPIPTQLYSSPFSRALKTCKVTFGDILINHQRVFPVERSRSSSLRCSARLWAETPATCDARSRRSSMITRNSRSRKGSPRMTSFGNQTSARRIGRLLRGRGRCSTPSSSDAMMSTSMFH
ncbi:hypothetical protein FRB95_006656 [Tulasnella sp. JGI-2019a]|nr:hypothetical protein FRB95_006656 [Tulasnella sp. JGI-2019a]